MTKDDLEYEEKALIYGKEYNDLCFKELLSDPKERKQDYTTRKFREYLNDQLIQNGYMRGVSLGRGALVLTRKFKAKMLGITSKTVGAKNGDLGFEVMNIQSAYAVRRFLLRLYQLQIHNFSSGINQVNSQWYLVSKQVKQSSTNVDA